MLPVHRVDKYLDLAEWLCYECENPALALEWVDKALTLEPESPDALSLKGGVLQALGRHEEAIIWFDKALEMFPEAPEILAEKARSLLALDRPIEAWEACREGIELLGDITVEVEGRELVGALYAVGVASLLLMGKSTEAKKLLEEGLAVVPHHPELTRLASGL